MSLAVGTRFGSYEVVEPIGAGGMGEVYRATDTKLKRDVAVKVLPQAFVQDADRLARFQREAEVLASLNHPNIATIYGLEQADGQTVIVMELVNGPTLADRIADGPIPPDEAMGIAFQIISALEAAHDKGIVHRDLKPANVKVRDDGTVKVLDFGISKPIDASTISGGSPVMTTPAVTQMGVILGTAAYMSPEQARGRFVDQRTDIWAFGCLLYEMLTGQPAFGGEDVMLTLARVLANETRLESIPGAISPAVRHTIRLCLEKDPRRRIADIRDVRLALEGSFETAHAVGDDEPARVDRPPWKRRAAIAAAFILGGAAFGSGVWIGTRPEPQAINTFDFTIQNDQTLRRTGRAVLAVSPDGRRFAYNTGDGIYVREMSELGARRVLGTEEDLTEPVFSPDGQSLAYFSFADRALKRIAISGGVSVEVAGNVANLWGMSWSDDNRLIFSANDGIYAVAASGGTPERIIEAAGGETFSSPELLPDGDHVLFAARETTTSDWDHAHIDVQSLTTGEREMLLSGGSDPHFVPTGHLIYAVGEDLLARPFDPRSLELSGGAVPLQQGVMRAGSGTDSANYGVTRNGTLIYLSGTGNGARRTVVWVDRDDGREEEINLPARSYQYVQLSPDGTQLVLDSRDDEFDIWVWNLERETLQRLTFDPGVNRVPVWARESARVAFTQVLDGVEHVVWQAADGSGVMEPLTVGTATNLPDFMPQDFTPGDEALIFTNIGAPRDLWMVPVGDPSGARALLSTPANELGGTVSRDGRFIAYQSDESGQPQIYVRPFPDVDSGGRWQVSTSGGTRPRWGRDGTELYYFIEGTEGVARLMRVPVDTTGVFRPGSPEVLLEGEYVAPNNSRQAYDVSLDGQRFLLIKNVDRSDSTARIIVVQNWLERLERLAPRE